MSVNRFNYVKNSRLTPAADHLTEVWASIIIYLFKGCRSSSLNERRREADPRLEKSHGYETDFTRSEDPTPQRTSGGFSFLS